LNVLKNRSISFEWQVLDRIEGRLMDKESRYFDFGPFRVDPDQRLLMRGQETIPVTPKAFETLLVLLRNSGRVVLKEDLMQTLWPDTFVEESNLSQHILQLRKALGSSEQYPQYIITVPGRGYRFAQKVEQVSAENGSGSLEDGHAKQRVNDKQEDPSRRGPWLWLVTGVLAVIAAAALGFLWRATRAVSRPLLRLNVELPDFEIAEPTTSSSFALSPGGNRVVYTGRGPDGTLRLYTRTLDQDRALPLAGTEGAYAPFLSPDGQTIGFFTDGKLKKIPVERGEAVVLCDASRGFGGSWSEDGSIIAALNSTGGLSRISSGDGSVQLVTQLQPERSDLAHIWPQVLPQGDSVLFTALSTNADISGATVDVQSLSTGKRKTLVRDPITAASFRAGICCICTAGHSMPLQWTGNDWR
jgi:DNA-binding winged helix-turn-helix (wHTH) protein